VSYLFLQGPVFSLLLQGTVSHWLLQGDSAIFASIGGQCHICFYRGQLVFYLLLHGDSILFACARGQFLFLLLHCVRFVLKLVPPDDAKEKCPASSNVNSRPSSRIPVAFIISVARSGQRN